MDATPPAHTDTLPADPVAMVRRLDADAISERLHQMERERRALLVLLRAARAVRRAPRKAVAGAH
jgi:hypothetical protein